jgi:hypothetical protein
MIDYTTMVSDFTDLDPLDMYQRLKKVEEPRVSNSDELFSQTVSSPYRHGVSSQPASVPEMTRVYKPLVSAPMQSHLLQVFIFTFGILSIIKSKQCISNNKIF